MKLLFIDTETTGTDPNIHSIIQIAAEYHENRQCKSKFNEHFSCGDPNISLDALKFNGSSLARVCNPRDNERNIVIKFVDWLHNLPIDKTTMICGCNVDFDINFLNSLFAKYNISKLDTLLYKKYDVSSIKTFLTNIGYLDSFSLKRGGTLEKLAGLLGIDLTPYQLHNAADDVALTAEIVYRLEKDLKVVLDSTKGPENGHTKDEN